jgi:hypothetical protein
MEVDWKSVASPEKQSMPSRRDFFVATTSHSMARERDYSGLLNRWLKLLNGSFKLWFGG